MSSIARTLTLMSFSGIVSLSPQGYSYISKTFFKNSLVSSPPSPPRSKFSFTPPSVVSVTPEQPVVQVLAEKGYVGCQVLNGFRDKTLWWYVCSDNEKTNKASFFNYKRSRQPSSSRIKKVTHIKKGQLTYEGGSTEGLIHLPFWMGSKNSLIELSPTEDCTFTKQRDGNSFSLSCKGNNIQKGI